MKPSELRIFLEFIDKHWVGKGWIIDEVAVGRSFKGVPRISGWVDAIFVDDPNQDDNITNGIGVNKNIANWIETGKGTRKRLLSQLEGKNVWLFEVKDYLNYEALGQILTYNYHFITDYPRTLIAGLGIICKPSESSIVMRIGPACKYYGIEVFNV